MKYNDMKTNKHYLMSAMNLIVAPQSVVTVIFQGDKEFAGKLGELGSWAKQNNAGVMRSCVSEDGERYGLFPCIVAMCPRVASALSVYSGYEVAVGDGRSFFTRKDALQAYITLQRAGVPVSPECLVWAITETPYTKPEAPKSQHPSLAEQYAKLPF
jgi:hypothetical protein